MAEQVRNLIAKWSAAWPSPLIISRQRDNGQFRINLVDYPEPENYEDQSEEVLETISYYLTVWMKQTEAGEIEKLAPIQLPGPYWRVYSPYTQLVQCIKFQFFATSSVTGYIGHSAIFTGLVLDSLEEDGEDIGVIPAEMWDAYKQYIEDKIIAAGVTTIDPTLSIQGAAADAKAAGDAVAELNGRLEDKAADLKSQIGDVSESLNYIPLQYANGYIRTNAATIDINSVVGDAGWTHTVCDCEENDQFTINGNGGGAPLLWAFIDSSGNRLTRSVAAANATDLVIVAPEDAVKLIVNTNDNRISYKGIKPDKRWNDLQAQADTHDAEIWDLERTYSLDTADALIRESARNPFRFKSFDKAYVTFVFDDLRSDLDLVASIFEEHGFPLCVAAIPSQLQNIANGLQSAKGSYTTGMAMSEVLNTIVSLGGEVLSHNSLAITEDNEHDYNVMYDYFVQSKKSLEEAGYTVNGIVRAGGTGAIVGDEQIERWLIGNYAYSNMGVSRQYTLERIGLSNGVASIINHIDSALEKNEWKRFCGHTLNGTETNVNETNLRTILDYCVEKNIAVVTYSAIFDEFAYDDHSNDISLLNDRTTALSNANVVAESHLERQEHFSETLNIPELLSFEKTDCIFHDNFHRANSKTIGQNGTNDYPMEYTDISQNVSESNNMQVGIEDNLAVGFNDNNVTAARRRIKAVNATQLPYKVKVTFTNTAWIAVGIVDINNYIVINATKRSVSIAPTGNVDVDNISMTHNADVECVEIYVYKDHVDVAVGGRIVLTASAKITSTLCGIVFRAGNIDILKYSSFSVYLPAQYVDIGYSRTIKESEAIVSNRLLGTLQLPNNTHSCLFDYETRRFSTKSLRFDLKYGDTYNNSVRTEIIPPIMRTQMFGLQTQIFEFDVLFPNDYLIDDSEDCIYQVHHTEDGINASGANPNICLYVKNDHMYLWINGAEGKIAAASEAVSMTYDLGTINKGNWHRYTLAFKQGYSPNYNPYTALYVDGTLKVFSNDLNMYNSPYSSYSKFGIYKWDWKSGPTQTNERVVYFANVNVWQ